MAVLPLLGSPFERQAALFCWSGWVTDLVPGGKRKVLARGK